MSDTPKTKIGEFWQKIKPIVGTGLQIVGDITGRETLQKIGDHLNDRKEESPELMAAHMEFEKYRLDWELELNRLEIEELKLVLADVQDARSREIEFMQANGGKRDWLMGAVVLVALGMYVAAWIFLAYGPVVPADKKDMFNMAAGQVFGFAAMAFSYYLGTTRSSSKKDDTINRAMK